MEIDPAASVAVLLADIQRWRVRLVVAAAVTFVAVLSLVGAIVAHGRHSVDDAAREAHIDSLTAFDAHQKALLKLALRQNNHDTQIAQQRASTFHATRAAVSIDYAAGTITAIGAGADTTTQQLPPLALPILAAADSAIPALEVALVGARLGWTMERTRGDSLERISQLKDERPGPSRCGWKCGAVIGVVLREAVPRVIHWVRGHPPAI